MFYIYKSHDKKITIKNFTIKNFFSIFRKLIRPGYENLKNLFARPNIEKKDNLDNDSLLQKLLEKVKNTVYGYVDCGGFFYLITS